MVFSVRAAFFLYYYLVADIRLFVLFFFFKHKPAYEMRISDWSSDVCSSDLFFALSKGKWTKPLAYKTDTVSIEIVATSKGVATIYDKEVLLYIASLMVAKLEAGVGVSQDFYFTAHDLFRVTGVNGSARSYARLSDALERLQGTQIKTNI